MIDEPDTGKETAPAVSTLALNALHEAILDVAQKESLPALWSSVCANARWVVPSRRMAVLAVDEHGVRGRLHFSRGQLDELDDETDIAMPALVDAVGADRVTWLMPPFTDASDATSAWLMGKDPAALVVVPITVRERTQAALVFAVGRSVVPDRDLVTFLASLYARHVGVGVSRLGSIRQRAHARDLLDGVERRFALFFEGLPDALIVHDMDGHILDVNPRAVEVFGHTAEELTGMTIAELSPPTVRSDRRQLNALHGTEEVRFEFDFARADGSRFPGEVEARRVEIDGEQLILALVRDCSAHREALDELRRTRDAAERATRAKSVFLANMSHEIRTPMNGVIGMTSLLLDTQLEGQQREFVEVIRSSGDALLTIINDILDFSKIEAGELTLERQPFDIRKCVEDALDVVSNRAAERRIDLLYRVDADVPGAVVGDVTRVRQVLVNLLSNGVKFTEKGEIEVGVHRGGHAADGSQLIRLSVRDTGVGIPFERMDRLFKSFSQVDPSTTRRYGGTGLGLAICKRLTTMMGGRIWVESSPGEGSTFHFSARLGTAAYEAPPHATGPHQALTGRRALVVDDNAASLGQIVHLLELWGMTVSTLSDGKAAIARLAESSDFDVVLVDLHLPGLNGLAVAELVHRRGPVKAPMVLLASMMYATRGDPRLRRYASTLAKPIKPERLFGCMLEVAARRTRSEIPSRRPVASDFDAEMGRRHPLRILVAEDNPINQKLVLTMLARLGYRPDVVSNGAEAVKSVVDTPYDVILMDIQMPEMDGLEATRTIRRQADATQPRIIALTANALQGDREEYLATGMDDYLSKPLHIRSLIEALRRSTRLVNTRVRRTTRPLVIPPVEV